MQVPTWIPWLFGRLVGVVVTLVAIVVASYLLIYNQQNGVAQLLGSRATTHLLLRNLIATVWQQFHFNIGEGLLTRAEMVSATLSTLELVLGALVLTALVGVPLGMVVGRSPHHPVARVVVSVSVFISEIPPYTLAGGCIVLFAMGLHLNSVGNPTLALPMATLALFDVGYVVKFTQIGLEEVRRQPYLLGARARGARGLGIWLRHTLRPTLVEVTALFGPQTVTMLLGTVMIQTAYGTSGLLIDLGLGINGSGVPLAIGEQSLSNGVSTVFLLGAMVLILNLGIDLLTRWLDPTSAG